MANIKRSTLWTAVACALVVGAVAYRIISLTVVMQHPPVAFTKWDSTRHAIVFLPKHTIDSLVAESKALDGIFSTPAYAQPTALTPTVSIFCSGPSNFNNPPSNLLHFRMYDAPIGITSSPFTASPSYAQIPTPLSASTGVIGARTFSSISPTMFSSGGDIDARVSGGMVSRPTAQVDFGTRLPALSSSYTQYIEPWSLSSTSTSNMAPDPSWSSEPVTTTIIDPKDRTTKQVNYYRLKDGNGNEVRVEITLEEP